MVLVLLVVGFFWFVGQMDGGEGELKCEVDEDCVRVQIGCCGCETGGLEKCVGKSSEDDYLAELNNCSEDVVFAAVYNCEVGECRCVDGECGFGD